MLQQRFFVFLIISVVLSLGCGSRGQEKNKEVIKFIDDIYFSQIFWELNLMYKDTAIVDTLFYEKDNKASDSLYDFRSFYFQKVFFDDNGLICEYQLSIAQYENSVRYFFQAKDQELYAYKIGVSLNDQKVLSLDTLKTLKLTK